MSYSGIEAHADEAHVFRQRLVVCAEQMELVQDAGRIRTRFRRGAAGVDETQDRDATVGEIAQVERFAVGIEERAIGGGLHHRQGVAAGRGRIVIVVAVAREIVRRGMTMRSQRRATRAAKAGHRPSCLQLDDFTVELICARDDRASGADFGRAEEHVMRPAQFQRGEIEIERRLQFLAVPGIGAEELLVVVALSCPSAPAASW